MKIPDISAEQVLSLLKKWWFSILVLPFAWILSNQFWMALKWEISFAYRYDYPFPYSIGYFFIDNFLLIVHEAGHTLFGIFGWKFLTVLGGTLLELIIPAAILSYGWINRYKITAQLGFLLTAFAFYDTAAYASDALYRQMPLIGNLPKSAHDFGNLFRKLHLLDYHMVFAWFFYLAGALTLVACLLLPLWIKPKNGVELEIEL